ncbi:MAG: cyclic nucleotide-binding domain-containing protein [Elusimicrobia bacterium]|nr:cyclic nucleotide-binding domain-containing protein [Elusimicrobiota bacterium]
MPESALAQRAALLARIPAFSALDKDSLTALAPLWREEHFPPNAIILKEGAAADRLYLILEGRAEAASRGSRGDIPLAVLSPGEIFGELALVGSGFRQSTVKALGEVKALSLKAADFKALLKAHPAMAEAFQKSADEMRLAKFLKQATPFTPLDARQIRKLVASLKIILLDAKTTVVRQGEGGRCCYLIKSGSVEALQESPEGTARKLATLGTGSIFGEMALLSESPRSATVRTLEPCELLILHREDLLKAMGESADVAVQLMETVSLRQRPRKASRVQVFERASSEGDAITILKNPATGSYFQLSPAGRFIWDRLDGRHTLRDLALEHFSHFQSFAPGFVAGVMSDLAAKGFLDGSALRADVLSLGTSEGSLARLLAAVAKALNWRVSLNHLDPRLSRLYHRGPVRWLYTKAGQALLLIVALAGAALFWRHIPDVQQDLVELKGGWYLWLALIPAYFLSVIIHEAGHAFTAKAFGREIPRAGVGWYWITPIAFVDTSDLWLAPKWPRMAVSLSGPYSEIVLAGFCALAASLSPGTALAPGLWIFSLGLYSTAFLNLNPFLEYDGYYLLMDYLEYPNLRHKAWSWLGQGLPSALRDAKRRRAEICYLASSAFFALGTAALLSRIWAQITSN